MTIVRIPWRDLQQKPEGVLAALSAGKRVEVTRHGVPVAVMLAPDPEETALDSLARAGNIPTDWRERHDRFMTHLQRGPQANLPADSPTASETLIALRDEDHL